MVITPSSQGEERIRRVGVAVDQAAKAVAAKRPISPSGIPENATALPKAKLQVLSGAFAGRELELTKALTTLGRPGVQVAAITRRAEGYFIVHVDSGKENDFPQVNGVPIGPQARRLNDNDVVQLAGRENGVFRKLTCSRTAENFRARRAGNPHARSSRPREISQLDFHHSVEHPQLVARERSYGRGAQDLAGARVERRAVQRTDEAITP